MRVIWWALLLEEYRTSIIYIKGTDNDAAATWGINYDITNSNITEGNFPDSYFVDKLDGKTSPLT